MAVEFKTEHTRTSEYLFLPELIKFNPALNGRHELPDIEWLITSMVKHGQLQPVSIKNNGGEPWLHIGHSRWRAGIEINKRSLTPVPFKLRCVYFKGSERDAFLATIAENRDRNATTPIDDAHNMARLERYGMTLEEIATEYHEETKWVRDRMALIELCEDAQKAVASGTLKPSAAKVLAKMSSDAQKVQLESGKKLTAGGLKRIASVNASQPAAPAAALNTTPTVLESRQTLRKWDKQAFLNLIDEYLEMDIPKRIQGMTCENAIRVFLGEMRDQIEPQPK